MGYKSETDEQLLSRLRTGDEHALSKLMERYYVSLCSFGNVFIDDMAVSEELVADVFYTIWCKRMELEIHTKLKSYLYVAVKNKALQQKRKIVIPSAPLDLVDAEAAGTPNALEQLILRELDQDIIDLVHTLPEKRRVIFELNRFESFTYKEISELLEISEKTVHNQMSLAIKYLRQYSRSFLDQIS